jgi:hypothetical protein
MFQEYFFYSIGPVVKAFFNPSYIYILGIQRKMHLCKCTPNCWITYFSESLSERLLYVVKYKNKEIFIGNLFSFFLFFVVD